MVESGYVLNCRHERVGALIFLPAATALRRSVGLLVEGHPFYLSILSLSGFIFIFGVAYLWAGITGRADALFLSVAGKLFFFGLVVFYWLLGASPLKVPLAASSDLLFALAFIFWLLRQRPHADAGLT